MKKADRSLSQVRTIYIVTTLFLVALSIYTFTQIENLIDSSDLVNHTNQVNQSLRKIVSGIFEAETNKDGFLLSGDSLLLQKRDVILNTITAEQYVLDSLIKDNPEQIHSLRKLQTAINEKFVSIKSLSEENWSLQINAGIKADIVEGIHKMDGVKLFIDEMTATEAHLLELRTQKYTRLSFITPLFIVVLFLGALLVLLFSYFRLNRDLKYSQNLQGELLFQNEEKEKRAAELLVANKELHFQSDEKEKRAAELLVANKELLFQSHEKEKRATELVLANKELQLFVNISSHDLQEPLRKMQMAASRIAEIDYTNLSANGKSQFEKMKAASTSMQSLIEDLLTYSRTNNEERIFETTDLGPIFREIQTEFKEALDEKHGVLEITRSCEATIIPFQFRQLMQNLVGNAIKFLSNERPPRITITSQILKATELNDERFLPGNTYCHIAIADNGIGFEPEYSKKIFEVFQRLHGKDKYNGTGIGLAIVKKIVENHRGFITATGQLNHGATFDIYIPAN